MCVEPYTALNKSSQTDVAFDHDEGAGFFGRELGQRQQNLLSVFAAAESSPEEPLASDARERAAQLGLKEHDHRQRHVWDAMRKDGMQQFQPQPE